MFYRAGTPTSFHHPKAVLSIKSKAVCRSGESNKSKINGGQYHGSTLTFHLQVDKHLLVAFPCTGVALVPAPVLNFHPPEEQGGIAVRDVRVEQACPSAEMLVLQPKLILVVVVAVDRDLLLVPVDYHGAGGFKAAGQDAVFRDDAGDISIWKNH